MFFTKKALNNVDPAVCNPIIVNQTNHSIVLFMDRGVLYNKQILYPGEAVGMTRSQTAGHVVPYRIHAVIGDESSLPTDVQSMKHALSTLVIPTAFIVGTLTAAYTAGTSRAATKVASGMVIRGMVIDSAALAAGSMSANRAAVIAEKLVEEYPQNYSAKSPLYMPGNRHVVIRGGINVPLTIETIRERQFKQIAIQGELKTPMDTLQEKVEYYTPSFLRFSSKTEDGESDNKLEAGQAQSEQQQQQARGLLGAGNAKASAPDADQDEEEQLRKAMAESLKAEEERKRKDAQYQKRLKESAPIPVTLF